MRISLLAGMLVIVCGSAFGQSPDQLHTMTDQLRTGDRVTVQNWVDRTNQGTVGVITGGVDGTYIRIGADLQNVLDDGDALRILPMLGRGSLQNIADLLYLKGVDVAIVQSDILAYTKMEHLYPGIDLAAQYITRLYSEEVHILARADVKTLADLKGRPVNIDRPGSGTAMTSMLMFNALGVEPSWRTDDQQAALEKLRSGDIAAMIYVVGEPAKLFTDLPAGTDLHFLPVTMIPALTDVYEDDVITSADYPNLVPPDDPVRTLAVGSVMAVYGWQPGSDRYRKVAHFVDTFFDKFADFQQPPRHPKWLEVDRLAEVPGWKRFPEATDWLRRHMSAQRDFDAFLASMPDLNPLIKARLLAQYKIWSARGTGPDNLPMPTINVTARRPPGGPVQR
jgi:TRAP transporter TAXI family solute receptor